ncbi:PilZ domain-containing protein [Gallaecimonas mangrovi]|uniref:PilZ domain-containing protein n=1 Tax=Gallaecimonas mangrovi TaxID=2291597 RepID=UPI001865F4C7|nr:PilZ domain-containing protein [Gallaecimonas mangrovi]
MLRTDDLRRQRRMEVNSEVRVTVEGSELSGLCSNLSANGMAIRLETEIAPGSHVTVHLEGGMAKLPPFVTEAVVIRCDPVESGFEVGVTFDD